MQLLWSGPRSADIVLILAHGAGAAMDSPFMESVAGLLAERDVATLRFEFAYMAARRDGGRRRPPPKAETLSGAFEAVIGDVRRTLGRERRLLIGGKSMGGRVASMIADAQFRAGAIAGLVVLGYPFHPPSAPEKLRTAHLENLRCPALIVHGERDPFGKRAEVEALTLSPTIAFHWAGDGDHDLGPRGGSGFTRTGNLAAAADAVAAFGGSLKTVGAGDRAIRATGRRRPADRA